VTGGPLVVLHVSPHPDDEAIAVPATLLSLRDAGHKVFNLLVSLGRRADHDRRRHEAREAAGRLGFELVEHDPPLDVCSEDDLDAAQARLARTLGEWLEHRGVDLVVGPSPHDGHHAHELVGRAARDALAARGDTPTRWWMWGLWADLPLPTLFLPFEERQLKSVLHGLAAYAGELNRDDYTRLVEGRAEANRVLGSERVFGFGAAERRDSRYAELLTEVMRRDGRWVAASPRVLDSADPLAPVDAQADLSWWVDGESFADRMRYAAAVSP
jgi:LmbE family N-acetylglucosaminyl deacetylase